MRLSRDCDEDTNGRAGRGSQEAVSWVRISVGWKGKNRRQAGLWGEVLGMRPPLRSWTPEKHHGRESVIRIDAVSTANCQGLFHCHDTRAGTHMGCDREGDAIVATLCAQRYDGG